MFETLSDLQAIRSASRRNPDALQAAVTNDPRAGMEMDEQLQISDSIPQVLINNEPITIFNQAKSLGVILSNDLRWNSHISSVSSEVHGALHKLLFRGWLLDHETKIILVQTLVMPYTDFSCLVYDDLPEYLNLKVERLANSAIQFIFNSRRDESITPYRIQLAWLTMKRRMEYFLGCVMFNILKHKLPLPNYEAIKTYFQDVRR